MKNLREVRAARFGAEARGMVQLKGHRAVGGMRASIYNVMPIEGVKNLVEYMKEFEERVIHISVMALQHVVTLE